MTSAALVFPNSRLLPGWWKQLTALRPQALWVGHILLHRVEALVRTQQLAPLDQFCLLILKALALAERDRSTPTPTPLQTLNERLHLGPQVLWQVIHKLEIEGLVQRDEDKGWGLTSLGRDALEHGTYPRSGQERRAFYFVHRNLAEQTPHYLSLNEPACAPWPAASDWHFDVRLLEACIRQPRDWKDRHRFPVEVQEVLGLETGAANRSRGSLSGAWQRVILDRPERLLAVFVLVVAEAGAERLLGFAVRQEGWELLAAPFFTLSADWRQVFPELTEGPSSEDWLQSWRAWCQPRNLPAAESDKCLFQRQQVRLHVTAPGRLVQRLRAAHSDIFKGETWLLAGRGRFRAAALVELTEAVARS